MWGSVLQLLVDDECIAARLDVVRVAHPCKKQSKPVLVPEHAWEGDRVYVYGSVLYAPSESLFRMWYMSRMEGMAVGDRDPRLNRQPLDFVLYATSQDGRHWERPSLGEYTFKGCRNNNIIFDLHSPSVVFRNEAGGFEKSYVMLGVRSRQGYWAAHSKDGLHWEDYRVNPALPKTDTCTLTWDPASSSYMAFHKRVHEHRGHLRRLVYLSKSRDMQAWTEPVLVMALDERDDQQTREDSGEFS